MKRLLVIGLLVFCVFGRAQARRGSLAFGKGDHIIGVGLNLDYYLDFAPGVGILYDYCAIMNMVSFGCEADMSFYDNGFYMIPAFRVGFHPFGLPPLSGKISVAKFIDPYVVAHAGPRIYLGDWRDAHDLRFHVSVDVGVRIMTSSNFGFMAEGDWNSALIGMVFKF